MNDDDLLAQNCDLRSSTQLDGITVMNPASGAYYALSGTAAFIWACLSRPTSIAGLKRSAAERYGVSAIEISSQIDAFISDMAAEGLVNVSRPETHERADDDRRMERSPGDQ